MDAPLGDPDGMRRQASKLDAYAERIRHRTTRAVTKYEGARFHGPAAVKCHDGLINLAATARRRAGDLEDLACQLQGWANQLEGAQADYRQGPRQAGGA